MIFIDANIIDVNKITVNPNDAIVIKAPFHIYALDVLKEYLRIFQECFPRNICVLVPSEFEIQVFNENQTDAEFEVVTEKELKDFLNIK